MVSATRRSPRVTTPSMWLRATSWNRKRTRRPRVRPRIRACLARSTSGSSIGSHWNGVCGFGTKDETATFTSPPLPRRWAETS